MSPIVWYFLAGVGCYIAVTVSYFAITWGLLRLPVSFGWRYTVESILIFPIAIPFLLWECLIYEPLCRLFWPRSVAEAVTRLMGSIDRKSLDEIANMSAADLCMLHFGLGMYIRNEYGLWRGNHELLSDCKTECADAASGMIIRELWERLRSDRYLQQVAK